ncbi:hypothetical protein DN069_21770 [Streptacidiphilus pinicola]|uniref:Uncharacterized protein n=1 Tax=Streptacidiphilus pinicola TaxID=2219663 RepID=A0A2X0K7P3_9ACTN|nr:hypothetical protein [Streptacidiphilus pinicola]RAG83549.1 hypothetical protein DN069_21770 [Streptacidiphilus pinicola]
MGAGNGYRVDVTALQATVRQLRSIADDLDTPRTSARYDTAIPHGTLGSGFAGATALADKHDELRDWLGSMIAELQGFIERYSGETKSAADAYEEQEHRTQQDFFSAAASAGGGGAA